MISIIKNTSLSILVAAFAGLVPTVAGVVLLTSITAVPAYAQVKPRPKQKIKEKNRPRPDTIRPANSASPIYSRNVTNRESLQERRAQELSALKNLANQPAGAREGVRLSSSPAQTTASSARGPRRTVTGPSAHVNFTPVSSTRDGINRTLSNTAQQARRVTGTSGARVPTVQRSANTRARTMRAGRSQSATSLLANQPAGSRVAVNLGTKSAVTESAERRTTRGPEWRVHFKINNDLASNSSGGSTSSTASPVLSRRPMPLE